MESFITPARIANAILQDGRFNGHYLIVEGKKDSKVYGRFFDKEVLRIKEAFGYENVIEVIDILQNRGFTKKAAIIDSDFSVILGECRKSDCIFLTDDHDIEMTIIKTPALEVVVEQFAGYMAADSFCASIGTSLRAILFNACRDLACLKLANKIHHLGLVFKPHEPDGNQIRYKNFISEKDLSYLGREKLVDSIINYSRNKSSSISDKSVILQRLDEVANAEYDSFHLNNGHDICNIIFIFLKFTLRVKNQILVDYNAIEECLAMAFDFCFFAETDLCKSLIFWAESESIQILKPCFRIHSESFMALSA